MKEVQRELRALDSALAKELKDVNLAVADMVADIARAKVPSTSGKARSTYKAKGEQRYAVIKAGGKKAEYVPWLEFGGTRGDEKKQSRPFVSAGRYIWPVVGMQRNKIKSEYAIALGQLLDKAGL
ncbi:MAG: hypothetical protein M3Q68_06845 [Actinomycetota bacterium]|nr:hypothetical protein [Actinomycetota bacterium]